MRKIFWIVALCSKIFVLGMPAQVIIIRHAETINPSEDPDRHLSVAGWERAGALVFYFQKNLEMIEFGTPSAIFCPKPSSSDPNFRTIETVDPLSKALGISIERPFGKSEAKEMAAYLSSEKRLEGKCVLLCWNHEKMDNLVKALGVESKLIEYPYDRHDLVYQITFKNHKIPKFCLILQRLMFGDASTPPKKFSLCP